MTVSSSTDLVVEICASKTELEWLATAEIPKYGTAFHFFENFAHLSGDWGFKLASIPSMI
jgi:hypothetical protein